MTTYYSGRHAFYPSLAFLESANLLSPMAPAMIVSVTSQFQISQWIIVTNHSSSKWQSNSQKHRKGVDLYIIAKSGILCPVKALLRYLAIKPKQSNRPLFIFKDGCPLTRQHFSNILNTSLSTLGYNSALYNIHSSIQMLGRWKSNAYQIYFKTPPQELAHFSVYLTTRYQ